MYLTFLGSEEKRWIHKLVDLDTLLHPTSFPNIATLAHLTRNDILWEAHDNFQKQTYRNRYHICTDQGLHKLSIPIKHVGGKDGRQKYRDVQIENGYAWQVQHWRTLQTAYRTSPFFEFYEDELAPLFHKRFQYLFEFNWESISFLSKAIPLNLKNTYTNSYNKTPIDAKDFRFLVNAKKEPDVIFEPYPQVFGERHGFISNTSSLDLLFNEGPNALIHLKKVAISC